MRWLGDSGVVLRDAENVVGWLAAIQHTVQSQVAGKTISHSNIQLQHFLPVSWRSLTSVGSSGSGGVVVIF